MAKCYTSHGILHNYGYHSCLSTVTAWARLLLNCSLVTVTGCIRRSELPSLFPQHPSPMKHGLKSISIENLIPE
jgi:hypothetical protein